MRGMTCPYPVCSLTKAEIFQEDIQGDAETGLAVRTGEIRGIVLNVHIFGIVYNQAICSLASAPLPCSSNCPIIFLERARLSESAHVPRDLIAYSFDDVAYSTARQP